MSLIIFFSEINDEDYDVRHVTKSAFYQARQKIVNKAFVERNDHVMEQFFNQKLLDSAENAY